MKFPGMEFPQIRPRLEDLTYGFENMGSLSGKTNSSVLQGSHELKEVHSLQKLEYHWQPKNFILWSNHPKLMFSTALIIIIILLIFCPHLMY